MANRFEFTAADFIATAAELSKLLGHTTQFNGANEEATPIQIQEIEIKSNWKHFDLKLWGISPDDHEAIIWLKFDSAAEAIDALTTLKKELGDFIG